MQLSITEAAHLMGKSPRQLRYMILQGALQAHKDGRRWVLDSESLPLTAGQRRATERRAGQLREAVEEALGPHLKAAQAEHYSVTELAAFKLARPAPVGLRHLGPEWQRAHSSSRGGRRHHGAPAPRPRTRRPRDPVQVALEPTGSLPARPRW